MTRHYELCDGLTDIKSMKDFKTYKMLRITVEPEDEVFVDLVAEGINHCATIAVNVVLERLIRARLIDPQDSKFEHAMNAAIEQLGEECECNSPGTQGQ